MLVLVTGGSGSGKSAFAERFAAELSKSMDPGEGSLFYLATMAGRDEESLARIARHRAQRAGYGFRTVECEADYFFRWETDGIAKDSAVSAGVVKPELRNQPAGEIQLISEGDETKQPVFARQSVVLLEDLSNLLANSLYPDSSRETKKNSMEKTDFAQTTGISETGEEGAFRYAEEDICRMPDVLIRLADSTGCLIIVTNEIFSEAMTWDEETLRYIRLLGEWNRRLAAAASGVVEVVCGIPLWHKAEGRLRSVGMWRGKAAKEASEHAGQTCKWEKEEARWSEGEERVQEEVPEHASQTCGWRKEDIWWREDEGKGVEGLGDAGEGKDRKVILVIGGAFQGKGVYVREHFSGEYEVVSSYHEEIRRQLQEGKDCFREAEKQLQKYRRMVIISDEIGGGLVPMDSFERTYRETTGRVNCLLAEKADCVIRVVCGIGDVLKGEATLYGEMIGGSGQGECDP